MDVPPKVRFAIGRVMTGADAKQREEKQRSFVIAQGLRWATPKMPPTSRPTSACLHEEY